MKVQAIFALGRGRQPRGGWGISAIFCWWLFCAVYLGERPAKGSTPFESEGRLSAEHPIDRLVVARLDKLGIESANLCSDAVFVRRVFLDAIGTLPTSDEAKEFLLSKSPDKRRELVDRLLDREEYADYWAMKWGDLLRVKSEFPINLWPNAVQAYHRWIRESIKRNVPYDRFARELLLASGSNFRAPPVNFYRATQEKDPSGLAKVAALTFMGARMQSWPKERREGLAVFFSRIGYKSTAEWKEEIVFFDREKQASENALFPDGSRMKLDPEVDPREAFTDWLLRPGNPWFARNAVNRVWGWMFGRGIIHPIDDLREDNPASNPELLAWLEKDFIASGYDLKALVRGILNSGVYQLASIPRSSSPAAEENFASYTLRRLEAEVLIDAINQATATLEKYSSPIPEPFTFIPDDQRAIALADGSITSSFLELFGRSSRDTGLESDRNNVPTSGQRVHLLNSSHIQRKIEQSPVLQMLALSQGRPRDIVQEIYLRFLSRFPTDDELQSALAYAGKTQARRESAIDLVWALVNSPEFLYRH